MPDHPISGRRDTVLRLAVLCLLCLLFIPFFPTHVEAGEEQFLERILKDESPRFFGLYFTNQKVGWQSIRIEKSTVNEVVLLNEAEFTQKVGAQILRMQTRDRRTYDKKTGRLKLIDYNSDGSTGSTNMRGVVSGKQLVITTIAGGRMHTETLPAPPDTLKGDFAVPLAILSGRAKEGLVLTSWHFDPSMKKSVAARQRIARIETRLVSGVKSRYYHVEGMLEDLNMPLSSIYDGRAELIKSIMAGFLESRWESERQAKSEESLGNFLLTSVVKIPNPLLNPTQSSRMRVVFSGIPADMARDTERQRWSEKPGGLREVVVLREGVKIGNPDSSYNGKEQKEALAETARIQLSDPAIQKVASMLKAESKSKRKLAAGILEWVFKNLEKRYTPTFSNASETMQTRVGDCGEHAVLYVALARAAGLPAREVTGIVYSPEIQGFGFHAWVEVWLNGWTSIDPSWNQFPVDPTHLAFASGGVAEQVRIVTLIGTMNVEAIETK